MRELASTCIVALKLNVYLRLSQSRRFVSPPPYGGGLKIPFGSNLREAKVADLRALRRAAEDSKSASSRIKIQFIEFLCERWMRVLA